ncbi:phosphoribosylformylglycinamidine synthase subunit PurQ [Limnoraphis robusta Tam1]|uniref:Phosphoribosylformylglycinamidine synthase subunit PurQ n=1 Tax=Limnoraphis robusta CCNP1315 TaxID=3110306 RepID=A0ABU5U4P2_9CYAN|nr:phosphoribosylformylglycinamidine synthase subunit PurQ [Limnoraphis robusta]MEA5522094.1 phosphoribosylformylglycinamidine synthase subunit PurQ [Limnoraphis robusta CCNP1315]MEA5538600.1 phosphoribosylformylglycinamidine synthase subunit PurQ [Limnoraphis robusta Tam1]MEA5545503.1 phosphoribosylformylglycinamidine synthase subunit PurQ [Limnoraphis robusta CCNP1324]
MKFGVVVFPGSNCDRDVVWVTDGLLGQPTRMIWHQDTDISDIDVMVIPGGFSYGDYLRCGAIARFSPVMQATVEHAKQGKFVIGICNGFQVLTELGLLPGALVRNRDLHFICDRVPLTVVNTKTPWTASYSANEVIMMPIAHGEGCYYCDENTLTQLEANNQVIFRYGSTPTPHGAENPNGSLNNIAGICNGQGNVLGMMPHPERASDPSLGQTDGMKLFKGLL